MSVISTDQKLRPWARKAAKDSGDGGGEDREAVGPVLAPPPKRQRRPMVIAAAALLIALGAALGAWVYTSSSDAVAVIGVQSDVARGQVIEREDLVGVQMSLDPALSAIPVAQVDEVVGKRAQHDLVAGGLVTEGSFAATVPPAAGLSVVGVSLPATLLPAEPLVPGDSIRVVHTPGPAQGGQQETETPTAPGVIEVEVLDVYPAPDIGGVTVVDVLVPHDAAATLAAQVARGEVVIVLDSREE